MEIEQYYGDQTAKRSGVPLMNHIEEGTKLLQHLKASEKTIRAYRLHPIYQDHLEDRFIDLLQEEGIVVAFVMNYAVTANSALSDIVFRNYGRDYFPLELKHPIVISDLPEVNLMLIADKCQNYKDFLQYHKGTHPRSEELEFYFRSWLRALGVSLDQFREYETLMRLESLFDYLDSLKSSVD